MGEIDGLTSEKGPGQKRFRETTDMGIYSVTESPAHKRFMHLNSVIVLSCQFVHLLLGARVAPMRTTPLRRRCDCDVERLLY